MRKYRGVHVRLHGKGNSNFHGARPVYQNDLDDEVDSDQQVVNQELSLSLWWSAARVWRERGAQGMQLRPEEMHALAQDELRGKATLKSV